MVRVGQLRRWKETLDDEVEPPHFIVISIEGEHRPGSPVRSLHHGPMVRWMMSGGGVVEDDLDWVDVNSELISEAG